MRALCLSASGLTMLSELLAILAPIVISVGAGFIWGKSGSDFLADFISRIVMNNRYALSYCQRDGERGCATCGDGAGRSLLFSVLRVGGGLLCGFIVCELMGLTGISRNVVLLQSAMPVAVFNYLLALRYNQKPEEVAAMVLVSTVIAFVGLPFLLLVILQAITLVE
jgi:predicted permease